MIKWNDYKHMYDRKNFYRLIEEGFEFALKHSIKSAILILKEYVTEPYCRGVGPKFQSVEEAENSIRKMGIRRFLEGYVESHEKELKEEN